MAHLNADAEVIVQTLRMQAWERAKGELMAVLQAFYKEPETHESLSKKMNDFIQAVEDDELG